MFDWINPTIVVAAVLAMAIGIVFFILRRTRAGQQEAEELGATDVPLVLAVSPAPPAAAGDAGGEQPGAPDIPGNPGLYGLLWAIGVSLTVLPFIFAPMLWDTTLFDKLGVRFDGGPTLVLFGVAYIALSFWQGRVKANQLAGAYFYSRALMPLESGPHFVPIGLMQTLRVSRTIQEFQCPGEPEEVFRGDDKEDLPEGMVRPIRVVTRAPKDNENGVLDVQMTVIASFVFQWRAVDVFDYKSNFNADPEEIERQLRDIGETTLGEAITEFTVNGIINNLKSINEKLAVKVQERFENTGVEIASGRMLPPDITHEVSSALADIPKAKAAARVTVLKAEAEETKLSREGQGKANAEGSFLNARARGQGKIRRKLGVSGETVVAADAVRDLSPKTSTLVLGEGGMANAMGLVAAAASVLKPPPPEPTPSTEPAARGGQPS